MLFDVVILIRYLHLPHIEVCCAGLHFFIIITLSLTLTELPNRTQLRENQLLTLLTVFSWSRSRFSNWSVLFSYNTPPAIFDIYASDSSALATVMNESKEVTIPRQTAMKRFTTLLLDNNRHLEIDVYGNYFTTLL